MNKKHLFWIIPLCLIIGFIFTYSLIVFADNKLLGKYDLYTCIYNHAADNGFNQHPIMIKTIQDQCICFRENNYTNLIEANC